MNSTLINGVREIQTIHMTKSTSAFQRRSMPSFRMCTETKQMSTKASALQYNVLYAATSYETVWSNRDHNGIKFSVTLFNLNKGSCGSLFLCELIINIIKMRILQRYCTMCISYLFLLRVSFIDKSLLLSLFL